MKTKRCFQSLFKRKASLFQGLDSGKGAKERHEEKIAMHKKIYERRLGRETTPLLAPGTIFNNSQYSRVEQAKERLVRVPCPPPPPPLSEMLEGGSPRYYNIFMQDSYKQDS